MNRKIFLYVFLGIFLLGGSAIILYVSTFIQPKIILTAEIKQVSDEDYRRIIDNEQVMYPKKEIDKFKHVSIGIKAVEPIGVNNKIKIERDIIHQYLKDNKNIQILSGGSFEDGNGKEYGENIEIYLIDLSEDGLRNILENCRYKVTWNDLWNKENSKSYYLRDYLN